MDQLRIRPKVEARPQLLAKVYAERLLVVIVIESKTAVVLDESRHEVVGASRRRTAQRADRLVVERVLAVELLFVIMALRGGGVVCGNISSDRCGIRVASPV